MRRRLVLLISFATPLVACASLLGDFDVTPSADAGPGSSSGTSGSSGSSGSSGAEGGADSGDEGGNTEPPQPAGVTVATTTNATCATVKYTKVQVTYCWGAEGSFAPQIVGADATDTRIEGFARPRLPTAEVKYVNFDQMTGAVGTADWFVGKGSDGQQAGTYAWGANALGQSAAGAAPATRPAIMKLGASLLQFDTVYAAPNSGCLVQNGKLFCWGSNLKCNIRSGETTTCNTVPTTLADRYAPVVEDESTSPSGATAVLRMSGGLDHSCVQRRASGDTDDIECWGSNVFGQVDSTSALTFVATPTQNKVKVKRAAAELVSGENHNCALEDATSITCWGKNDSGQANPLNPSVKTQPFTLEAKDLPGALSHLRAAGDLSCVVSKQLAQPSRAWCWGSGAKGRATGDNGPLGKVAGIQDVTALAVGRSHACAVAKKEGAADSDAPRVYCWGNNAFHRVDPRSPTTQEVLQPIEIKFPAEPAN